MADFPKATIEVREESDNWGAFSFDLSNSIPTNDSVTSVSVDAYIGNVKPVTDKSTLTNIASLLIDPDRPVAVNGNVVSVYFVYPGITYRGQKVTLILRTTTSSGAVHPFYFQYVKIK